MVTSGCEFAAQLGIPSVLRLPDDGLHSPNEKVSLENCEKRMLAAEHFFDAVGRQAYRRR